MRLKLISCEVFEREVTAAVGRSNNHIDIEFLPKAPHQLSDPEMLECVQTRIDHASRCNYQAVLLVAGSCKQGLTGLQARCVPVVLPRAKDCISLLLERAAPAHWTSSTDDQKCPRETGVRARRELPHETYWMAPVEGSKNDESQDVFPSSPLPWWPARLGRIYILPPQSPPHHRAWSSLEMLVRGYWHYTDFLVVPAGWRVVVNHDQGSIAAEEVL